MTWHLSVVEWDSAYGRGAALAEALAPDIKKLLTDVIDQWIEEHTTLAGEKKDEFRSVVLEGATARLGREISGD